MDYTNELIPYSSVDYFRENLKTNEVTIHHHVLTKDQASQSYDNVNFIYLTKGNAILDINGQTFHIKAGQLILLMSYHIFSLKQFSQEHCEYYHCQFSIGLLLLSNTSKLTYHESLIELDRDVPIVTLTADNQKEMQQLCRKLATKITEDSLWTNDLRVLSAITSVLYLFLQGLKSRQPTNEQAMALPWKLLQYIHFHHQKKLTIEEMATTFELSPKAVSSQLKQLTNLSFSQNLTRVRIINATALLEFNALSVNQIGRIVGFQTDASFYKAFKQVHLMTPQTYRQTLCPTHNNRIDDDSYDVYSYIYENYRSQLTLTIIAKDLSLTPKRVSQLVTDNFQMTVNELLGRIRCAIARGLILSTSLPFNTIAELVGFNDSKLFRQHFKQYYHLTPSNYRTQHLKQNKN